LDFGTDILLFTSRLIKEGTDTHSTILEKGLAGAKKDAACGVAGSGTSLFGYPWTREVDEY